MLRKIQKSSFIGLFIICTLIFSIIGIMITLNISSNQNLIPTEDYNINFTHDKSKSIAASENVNYTELAALSFNNNEDLDYYFQNDLYSAADGLTPTKAYFIEKSVIGNVSVLISASYIVQCSLFFEDIDRYIIIQDCVFTGRIYITNSSHITLRNCSYILDEGSDNYCKVENSNNIDFSFLHLERCTIINSNYFTLSYSDLNDISLYNSNYTALYCNNISNNEDNLGASDGLITLELCSNGTIAQNILEFCADGLILRQLSNFNISFNTFSNLDYLSGLNLPSISPSLFKAIRADYVTESIFIGNSIHASQGIWLIFSNQNLFSENLFDCVIPCRDAGFNNQWYYNNRGNYWSDYYTINSELHQNLWENPSSENNWSVPYHIPRYGYLDNNEFIVSSSYSEDLYPLHKPSLCISQSPIITFINLENKMFLNLSSDATGMPRAKGYLIFIDNVFVDDLELQSANLYDFSETGTICLYELPLENLGTYSIKLIAYNGWGLSSVAENSIENTYYEIPGYPLLFLIIGIIISLGTIVISINCHHSIMVTQPSPSNQLKKESFL